MNTKTEASNDGPEYPLTSRRKMDRLERRAVLRGWPVPLEKRAEIVERQMEVLQGDNTREAIQAAKTLVEMVRQNRARS